MTNMMSYLFVIGDKNWASINSVANKYSVHFTVTPTCMTVFSDWQGSSFRLWSMLFFLFYWRRFFLHWWLKQDYKFLFKRRCQARNIRRATELMDLVLSESSRRKRDCHHMWWWHHIVLQCQPCHCPWTL